MSIAVLSSEISAAIISTPKILECANSQSKDRQVFNATPYRLLAVKWCKRQRSLRVFGLVAREREGEVEVEGEGEGEGEVEGEGEGEGGVEGDGGRGRGRGRG